MRNWDKRFLTAVICTILAVTVIAFALSGLSDREGVDSSDGIPGVPEASASDVYHRPAEPAPGSRFDPETSALIVRIITSSGKGDYDVAGLALVPPVITKTSGNGFDISRQALIPPIIKDRVPEAHENGPGAPDAPSVTFDTRTDTTSSTSAADENTSRSTIPSDSSEASSSASSSKSSAVPAATTTKQKKTSRTGTAGKTTTTSSKSTTSAAGQTTRTSAKTSAAESTVSTSARTETAASTQKTTSSTAASRSSSVPDTTTSARVNTYSSAFNIPYLVGSLSFTVKDMKFSDSPGTVDVVIVSPSGKRYNGSGTGSVCVPVTPETGDYTITVSGPGLMSVKVTF